MFLLGFVLGQALLVATLTDPTFACMTPTAYVTVSDVQCRIVHFALVIAQVGRCRECLEALLAVELLLPGMRSQFVEFEFLVCRV